MEEKNMPIEKEIKEITKPDKKTKSITLKINGNVVTVVVLVILIFVSVTQAIELGNLKEKIVTGEAQAATSGTSSSTDGSTTPANLQNLPSMVGGC